MKQLQLLKQFSLLFCLVFFYSCQQQVSEITYDLDAQSITNQTRDMQRKVILQEIVDYTKQANVKTFNGFVSEMDALNPEKVTIKMMNKSDEELLFDVDFMTSEKMTTYMKLSVSYLEEESGIRVVEIKKED